MDYKFEILKSENENILVLSSEKVVLEFIIDPNRQLPDMSFTYVFPSSLL